MSFYNFVVLFLSGLVSNFAQDNYWQQEISYDMRIDFDVQTHQYNGISGIDYTNNSPDTLDRVFFHLYFNAFQPGSMMDLRSRTIPDPDSRIMDRILKLDKSEQGFQIVKSLSLDGMACQFDHVGTILEVTIPKKINPGEKVRFDMDWEGQVPVQIRRSGRNNKEGIDYSMSQWYPKMCEYDIQGWHANPYVAREFYGVWGEFRVEIQIDSNYTVAAGGILQNPGDIGHGYTGEDTSEFVAKTDDGKLNWIFKASRVHDFMWAADRDYTHLVKMTDQGTEMHYFFDPGTATVANWEALHQALNKAEAFMNAHYGEYPYPVYSIIQGGDGGMEYAMGTLITGRRDYASLVGVSIHEWMHSWYQMVLGTNESLYAWMDEGFTSYASNAVMNYLREQNLVPGKARENPFRRDLMDYALFSQSGIEEPLSTHSDHFVTNKGYGEAAYTKGAVFISQLEHIVGRKNFNRALKRYFNEWKFRHPTPNDFIRVFEKESGLELDWYKEYMMYSLKTIDYAIDTVYAQSSGGTQVVLKRIGFMPMPQDVEIELQTGEKHYFTIPLRIMRGYKSDDVLSFELLEDWPWTHPVYEFNIPVALDSIKQIKLDPLERTADIDPDNNSWLRENEKGID